MTEGQVSERKMQTALGGHILRYISMLDMELEDLIFTLSLLCYFLFLFLPFRMELCTLIYHCTLQVYNYFLVFFLI